MNKYNAKLIKKIQRTDDVFSYYFELDDEISFSAGQFVNLYLEPKLVRAYSVASSPSEDLLEVCFNIVPGGKGSNILAGFQVDHELLIQGPFGFFKLNEESTKDIVLIGTGTGIAPLRSMLLRSLEINPKRKITMYFGVRYEENLFYHEEFLSLDDEYENFEYVPVLSRASDDWNGEKGRVTSMVEKYLSDESEKEAYLCGSNEMIQDVKKLLLDNEWSEEDIYHEKFY